MQKKFTQNQLPEIAKDIGSLLKIRKPLFLYGDMGAGKTTLTQYIVNSLNTKNINVTSPTFTIMQSYPTSKGLLWHIDLYRLSNPDAIADLGLDEIFYTTLAIVEWPERLSNQICIPHFKGILTVNPDNTRSLKIEDIA